MRNFLIAALLIALIITISGPVVAGIGVPDVTNVYANVGVLIVFDTDIPDDPVGANVSTFCSGVLISETHFLTAAHCIDWISLVENPYIGVSFSNFAAPIMSTTIPVIEWFMHPDYPAGQWVAPGKSPGVGFGTQNDLGVVVLDRSPGIHYASLPPVGFLDDLKTNGELMGQPIVNVGYGVVSTQKGPLVISPPDGVRRVSTSRFAGLTQYFLKQRQNINAGDEGGSSWGDSGSPKFLTYDQDTVLAIASWGGATSRGILSSVRVDTYEALSFIEDVIQP